MNCWNVYFIFVVNEATVLVHYNSKDRGVEYRNLTFRPGEGVLATRIDADLPTGRNSDIPTLSWRKFLKTYTLFWIINQCYCSRTIELLLF